MKDVAPVQEAYRILDYVHKRLGMTLDQRQQQLTVYGRSPLHVHDESWAANEYGRPEQFVNGELETSLRLSEEYIDHVLDAPTVRDTARGLLFLSQDRAGTTRIHCPVRPAPQDKYRAIEGFQTLRGNFTLAHRVYGRRLATDYQKFFADPRFVLHAFMDSARFEQWAEGIRSLADIVQQKGYPNVPVAYLDLEDTGRGDLVWYIDCGIPAKPDNTLYSRDELRAAFCKPA